MIEESNPKTFRSQLQSQPGAMLFDFWYPVLATSELRRGQMKRQVLLGVPILLCCDSDGKVFALGDHCPHRGMPLSFGRFDGRLVECCYHGWKFDGQGKCQIIPSLPPDSDFKTERIHAVHYDCAQADELIWVYMPRKGARAPQAQVKERPEIPRLPVFSEKYKQCLISRKLACNVDHGIVGLMDPAHGPFVHRSFWWRRGKSIHLKSKSFEPIPNGFRMSAHKPSHNSAAYKLLKIYGRDFTTTIDFLLPNVRYEQVRCGPYWFSSRTTVTPITEKESRLDFVAAWDVLRGVPFLTSIFQIFAKKFIAQDQRIIEMQAIGLKGAPSLMLIDDADTQAKWYYRLKAAYLEAQQIGGEVDHPLKSKVTLHWQS